METERQQKIEDFAMAGRLNELKLLFDKGFVQGELDSALGLAIAYSRISTADYLVTLGASFASDNYDGVYYAVHNNKFEGLKYSISKGVNINVNDGMILKTAIVTAVNTKDTEMIEWILENGANPEFLPQSFLDLVKEYGTPRLKEIINATQHGI